MSAEGEAQVVVTRELLSSHSVTATFKGLVEHPCRFRTSRCPHDCGHGGTVAEFGVVDYLDYERPGEYGDAKQKTYHQRLSEAAPQVRETITALAPGSLVRLRWIHEYVTRSSSGGGTSKSPERHILELSASA